MRQIWCIRIVYYDWTKKQDRVTTILKIIMMIEFFWYLLIVFIFHNLNPFFLCVIHSFKCPTAASAVNRKQV